MRCRVNDENTEYTTLVEIDEMVVTPEHFKQLFLNFAKEATLINKECTVCEYINMEEGQFETLAQIYKFPLVPERIIVNTQYLSTEHEGRQDYHLCIFSS